MTQRGSSTLFQAVFLIQGPRGFGSGMWRFGVGWRRVVMIGKGSLEVFLLVASGSESKCSEGPSFESQSEVVDMMTEVPIVVVSNAK